jgi:hypothetical protein
MMLVGRHSALTRSGTAAVFVGVALLLVVACSDETPAPTQPGIIFGSGVVVSDERAVDSVHAIRMEMAGTVHIGLADSQSVDVSVDDNVLEYVETVVESGTLVIRPSNGYDLANYDLDVDVRVRDLTSLSCEGIGSIRSATPIEVDELRVSIPATGSVVLEVDVAQLFTSCSGLGNFDYCGAAASHVIAIPGTGTVSAYDLATAQCDIAISGFGTVLVTVSERLDVTIDGLGTVYYKGRPEITETIEGSGQVIDAN